MSTQPDTNDIRVTGRAGDHICGFAYKGEHKGNRFVKPKGGLWLPAGKASPEEMNAGDLFNRLAGMFGGFA